MKVYLLVANGCWDGFVAEQNGKKGLFIAMPSKKTADGEYRDIAHPINSATRELLQTTILSAYKEALAAPEFQG